MIEPIDSLEKALSKLPGFGRRSATRAALALVREPERLLDTLLFSLKKARENVVCCEKCGAFTLKEKNPCDMCTNMTRESNIICVVEEPADILQIENSGAFHGRYHSLGGKLSPARRMGPEQLRIATLVDRVVREGVTEILLALSTDMEGDATASYIAEILKGTGVKVSRLAFGLPADSGIAYSDPLTLKRAIVNRVDQ